MNKKEKQEIINEIESLTLSELKHFTFAFLRIKEHIWQEYLNPNKTEEYRRRENLRLKIAQKHINNWYKEYE